MIINREITAQSAVHLICGATGAGKTTYARALCEDIGGLRFSIDDWMAVLYGDDRPAEADHAWYMARIDRIERQIWTLVQPLAAQAVPAVLDLGFTIAEHRSRFHRLAQDAALTTSLHVLEAPVAERWHRVQQRNRNRRETFALSVSRSDFDFVEALWEPPTEDEIARMNGRVIKT